jgi:feruloyl esterase
MKISTMRSARLLALLMPWIIGAGAHSLAATPHGACDALAKIALPNTKILSATSIAAGQFAPAEKFPASAVPAFCRVSASLNPSADSDIQIEVWLPDEWNGKYLANGIGGWGGAMAYPGLLDALRRGYATSATDTGHRGNMGAADFALGHPEKVKDFAWRAVHEMTVQSKALINAYYGTRNGGSSNGGTANGGTAIRRSYFSGCSNGGRQGLMEAQKFPADFDGIIAGAPAADWVGLTSGALYTSLLNIPKGKPPIITPVQAALIHKAVIAQCDAQDGLRDGELADPRLCGFNARSLVCRSGQPAGECLTQEQADVADKFYQAVRDPKSGRLILPGSLPGSEPGWGMVPVPMPPAVSEYRFVVYGDSSWDPYTFDLSKGVAAARRTDIIDALNPDLSAFAAHGKLIQFHGLADPIMPTEASINYFESVVARRGSLAKTAGFYRLFLVPGMGHCMGGYDVDWVDALDQWVENGKAPAQVIGHRLPPQAGPPNGPPPANGGPPPGAPPGPPAAAGAVPSTAVRPICAYPDMARYNGAGAADAAASFSCKSAPRGVREGDGPVVLKPIS